MTNKKNIEQLKVSGKASGTFYFKQFKVKDDRSTMKVGTDAVLLGAVVDLVGAKNILEVGTGCGVIALMLAQRSDAKIDVIDIDAESVKQAEGNVEQSPWKERITVYHRSLQDFSSNTNNQYDLIVSNPPYFTCSLKSPSKKRNISRHSDSTLTFEELLNGAAKMLTAGGGLWVILPVKESAELINLSINNLFSVHYMMNIYSKEGNRHYRNIIQLKKSACLQITADSLTIKDNAGSFTNDYIRLMSAFYLDF